MRALSFMGIGISSSELSCSVVYCCCASAAPAGPAAAAFELRFEAVPDAAALICERDGGRRRACRADVRRPMEVNWLPWPAGVGDTVAIVVSVMLWRCEW